MIEKNKKRALRRHHYYRRKKQVKQIFKNTWYIPKNNSTWFNHTVNIMIDTRTPCSCYMCGNPRKHFNKKTRQEILADYELINYDINSNL